MCVYREPQVVRCGGSTVLNIIPEKEDRTFYQSVGFHGGSPLQETRMPVRCRIVLVSMAKQGGCGMICPSLRGRIFFMH